MRAIKTIAWTLYIILLTVSVVYFYNVAKDKEAVTKCGIVKDIDTTELFTHGVADQDMDEGTVVVVDGAIGGMLLMTPVSPIKLYKVIENVKRGDNGLFKEVGQ